MKEHTKVLQDLYVKESRFIRKGPAKKPGKHRIRETEDIVSNKERKDRLAELREREGYE